MNQEQIIEKTKEYVKETLKNDDDFGHGWWHVYRVWKNSIHIAEKEDVDLYVVQLGALLHDIADWKFHGGDISIGPKLAREWLEKLGVEENIILKVVEIVKHVSFMGAGVKSEMKIKEGFVIQDADRLDAIGAIGIARCFSTGAKLRNPIYDPNIKPKLHESFEEYKSAKTTSINHFYEKLLLLRDGMNTETARRIANQRHNFMEQYLNRFFKEWEGED